MKTGTRTFFKAAAAFAVSAALCAFAAGCEKKKQDVIINIDDTAKSILDGVEFDDELEKLDREAVKYLYGIDDTIAAAVYTGSGATAEEIAVFDAGTDEEGEKMLKTVEKHVEEQIESYKNYVPSEVARLEKAVIVRSGRYVMLCVTDDDGAAKGIMDEAVGR